MRILRKSAPTFKQVIEIKDGGQARAVKVTIDAPYPEDVDVQLLAQQAWLAPGKRLKLGLVTVKVQKFRR